jgi:hypothetical protein
MKSLARDAISKVNNEIDKADLQKKFEAILTTTAISKDPRGLHGKYNDLTKGQFELTEVRQIEYTDYTNSIFGKTADFTLETINRYHKVTLEIAIGFLNNLLNQIVDKTIVAASKADAKEE